MAQWPVYRTSDGLVDLAWITGKVAPGDVHYLFNWLCRRFDHDVESIRKDHSWGWAYRPIRGSSKVSNHAKAIAIDLNAPAHPLGKRGTFTPKQVLAIRAILRELDGVVRWGGDYRVRADEMHWEVNASPAAVAAVVRKLKEDEMPAILKLKPGQDRFGTCNVAGFKSAQQQLEAATIAAKHASIVALQEVEESKPLLQAKKANGFTYLFPYIYDAKKWKPGKRGNRLVLAKKKGITPYDHYAYAQAFTHRETGQQITLVSVHLLAGAWTNQQSPGRKQAWINAVEETRKFADTFPGLVLLTGDWNRPDAYQIKGYRLLPSAATHGRHARFDKHYIRNGYLPSTQSALTIKTPSDHKTLVATYKMGEVPMDAKVVQQIAKATAEETVKELMRTNLWVKPDAKGQRTVRKLFQQLARSLSPRD